MYHLNMRSVRLRCAAFGLAAVGCFLGLVGCYQKVVRAEGFGSERTTVYEPDFVTDEEAQQKKDAGRIRIPRPPKPPKITY